MKELYLFCEGETEQGFCNQLVQPHLFAQHDGRIHTPLIQHSKHNGKVRRGGVPGRYEPMRRDIQAQLKGRKQPNVFLTIMIDLYRLPRPEDVGWARDRREDRPDNHPHEVPPFRCMADPAGVIALVLRRRA